MTPLVARARVGLTVVAAVSFAATMLVVVQTSTGARDLVVLVAAFAVTAYALGLLAGSRLGIALGAGFALAAETLELLAADEDRWFLATALGVLVYASAELGFEAIDRGDGSRRTRGALHGWIRNRALVAGVSAVVGALAWLVQDQAPVRSLPLQFGLVVLVLGGLAVASDVGAVRSAPNSGSHGNDGS